jgi:hypothetical protein
MGIEYIPFGAGGAASQARNPIRTYVELAMPSGGLTITNSNGANAISAYTALSSPANALSGLLLMIQNGSVNTSHCQVYVRVNGAVAINGIYFKLNTSDSTHIPIPLKIPAGATVELAIRTNVNGHVRLFSVHGVEANSIDAPGYSLIKNLTLDTAATLAGVVNVPGTDTWIVSADVDDNYDAFMTTISDSGTAPTTAQINTIAYGLGTPGSNALNNPNLTGAVNGSPGTMPTNTNTVNSGLTRTIVGTGTVSGVPYVDIRFNGTTTNTFANILLETVGVIAAANGQHWTADSYIAIVGGSLANITSIKHRAALYDGALAYLGEIAANPVDVMGSLDATLSRRIGASGTITSATAASINPYIQLTFANGATIDITLRIGLPFLAQVAAPSSAFWRFQQRFSTAQPYIVQALSPLIHIPLTNRSIVATKITCPVADSVNFRPGLIGFKN